MIMRVTDRQQISKFLLLIWNPEPSQRRLLSMYDTLEDANEAVKWDPAGLKTGRESHQWGARTGYTPQAYRRGAPDVPTID